MSIVLMKMEHTVPFHVITLFRFWSYAKLGPIWKLGIRNEKNAIKIMLWIIKPIFQDFRHW
jgi:hypothetical protein